MEAADDDAAAAVDDAQTILNFLVADPRPQDKDSQDDDSQDKYGDNSWVACRIENSGVHKINRGDVYVSRLRCKSLVESVLANGFLEKKSTMPQSRWKNHQ